MRSADLRRLRGKADAEWREAVRIAAEDVLAIADPAERMRAYVELSRVLAEEGETLPADADDWILRSLRASPAPAVTESDRRKDAIASWSVERRGMALLFTLRPIAAALCALAAVLPFVAGAWRWGWSLVDALAAFLTPGWSAAGVALAILVVGIAARRTARADTVKGLAGLVMVSFVAGVVGLAVALR